MTPAPERPLVIATNIGRMRLIKDGYIIEDEHLQELLTEADSLDRCWS
jgi:hypothetical protein